ncbi:MAG: hypothetical protein QME51_03960, partial [Planctomycetota bacterium]|nr:hypothetical protein [Planctomycetota bacterium]
TYEAIRISDANIINNINLDLAIRKAPLFAIDIKIPDGWRPRVVLPSDNIKIWDFREDSNSVRIEFIRPVIEKETITFEVEKYITQNDKDIKILPLIIPEAKQSEYYLAITADEDTAVKANLSGAITEISINKLPPFYQNPTAMKMAFHSNSSQWTLGLTTIPLLPLVRANIYTGLIIREGQMKVINLVNYSIQNSKVNQLRIQLPSEALNPQISGDAVKNIIHSDNNIKEIGLVSKIKGNYSLSVSYDITSADITQMSFEPLKVLDGSLESGFIMLSRGNERTEINATEINNIQMIPSIEKEIENRASAVLKQLPYQPTQFFSFNKPDARVAFSVKTHELSALLPAKIVSCDLFSLSRQSGEIVTYVSTVVENTAKQYLTVTLPPSAVLWGTYLDDKPVKPIVNNKQEILIPLMPEKGAPRKQTNLVFVYVQSQSSFTALKKLDFIMPRTDLNIEKATWHFFLPQKYYLGLPQGNMEFVYHDPVITYPSLSRWAIDGVTSFIYKLWMAIPPIIKKMVLWLIIIVILSFVLIRVIKAIINYLLLLRLNWRRIILYGSGGLLLTTLLLVTLSVALIPNLMSAKTMAKQYKPAMSSSSLMVMVEQKEKDETSSEKVERVYLPKHSSSVPCEEEAISKEAQDFRGDVEQLKKLTDLSRRAREQGEKKQASKDKKSVVDELKEEEASEFDTDSPIKGEGAVYDTIGIGGGLGGKRMGGRGKVSSKAEKAPAQPAPAPPAQPESPEKSGKWIVDETRGVTWTATGSVGSVKVEYYNPDTGVRYDLAGSRKSEQIFGRTEKGRSVGALPINVSVPLQNTYYYAFESLNLGKSRGQIGFYCFSGAIVLFLQLLGWFVISGTLFYVSRQNLKTAIIVNVFIAIGCVMGHLVSDGVIKETLISGFGFSIVLLTILIIYYKITSNTAQAGKE